MEEKKRQIMISEIKKWRENRLLPEVYCNFLLGLYTEGNTPDSPESRAGDGKMVPALKKAVWTASILLLLTLLLLFFIYFTQFSPFFQLGVLGTVFLVSVLAARYYRERQIIYMHLYIILATFISFIFMIVATEVFFGNDRMYLGSAVIVLCLLWIVCGWRLKLPYLYISGGTGVVLFIGFLFVEQM